LAGLTVSAFFIHITECTKPVVELEGVEPSSK